MTIFFLILLNLCIIVYSFYLARTSLDSLLSEKERNLLCLFSSVKKDMRFVMDNIDKKLSEFEEVINSKIGNG